MRRIERLPQRAGYSHLASTTDRGPALSSEGFEPDLVLLDLRGLLFDGSAVLQDLQGPPGGAGWQR